MGDAMDAIKNATRAQKSAAFEWLRSQALKKGNPDWFHAAVAMEELARLNREAAWIPVSERLPDQATSVLVTMQGRDEEGGDPWVEFAEIRGDGKWYLTGECIDVSSMITHWQAALDAYGEAG